MREYRKYTATALSANTATAPTALFLNTATALTANREYWEIYRIGLSANFLIAVKAVIAVGVFRNIAVTAVAVFALFAVRAVQRTRSAIRLTWRKEWRNPPQILAEYDDGGNQRQPIILHVVCLFASPPAKRTEKYRYKVSTLLDEKKIQEFSSPILKFPGACCEK